MKTSKLIRILLILSTFLNVAQGQDCNKKNQDAFDISSGNLNDLSKTVSVVFKDKTYNSLHYLIQVAGNDEIQDESYVVTQKELQEVLRYVYQDKLTYDDLLKMKEDLVNQKDFKKLTELQQIDAQRVLDDIIYVENRMNQFRNISNMYCRFALTDNPFDQFPKDSVFNLDPDSLSKNDEREKIIEMKNNRSVCGLCWYKKK